LWRLPAITIAAVHGYAVGGGFEMALLCDQCIASRDARFALPETGLGMIPGVAGTQTLPRLVGPTRALRLVLNGEEFDARAAHRLGLVARVVPRAGLFTAALALARRVARLDRDLVTRLKRSINEGTDRSLIHSLALEHVLTPWTLEPSNPSVEHP
jgi:enoyl-CoA hydratase/carnithine racemase